MSVDTYASYKSKLEAPYGLYSHTKASMTTIAGRLYSTWAVAPNAGAAPTTAANPTRTQAGSLLLDGAGGGHRQASSGVQRLAQIYASCAQPGTWILCDRLAHSGGLSGTVTGEQTTNLPMSLPARQAAGSGIMMGLEIYTAIGTSAGTATIRYTDSGDNSHTSQVFSFGATGFATAGRLCLAPCVTGEWDIKAIQGVTLAATSGTAGNFGVTLFRPLMHFGNFYMPNQAILWDAVINGGGYMPVIHDDACLFWLFLGYTTASGIAMFDMRTILE